MNLRNPSKRRYPLLPSLAVIVSAVRCPKQLQRRFDRHVGTEWVDCCLMCCEGRCHVSPETGRFSLMCAGCTRGRRASVVDVQRGWAEWTCLSGIAQKGQEYMFTIRDSLSTDVTAFRVSYDAFVDDVQARCSRLCQSLMQEVALQIQSINFHGF